MGNPLTSSERRGIVIIGCVALLIIGSGLLLGHCRGKQDSMREPEIREIMARDSVARSDRQAPGNRILTDSIRHGHKTRRHDKDTLKQKRKGAPTKTYRRRSHLDDQIGKRP